MLNKLVHIPPPPQSNRSMNTAPGSILADDEGGHDGDGVLEDDLLAEHRAQQQRGGQGEVHGVDQPGVGEEGGHREEEVEVHQRGPEVLGGGDLLHVLFEGEDRGGAGGLLPRTASKRRLERPKVFVLAAASDRPARPPHCRQKTPPPSPNNNNNNNRQLRKAQRSPPK